MGLLNLSRNSLCNETLSINTSAMWQSLCWTKIGMLIAAHDIFFVFFIFMNRDGEKIILCSYARCLDADCICNFSSENLSQIAITSKSTSVTLQLRSGLYHERYRDLAEVFFPLVSENIFISILIEDPRSLVPLYKASNVKFWDSFGCYWNCIFSASLLPSFLHHLYPSIFLYLFFVQHHMHIYHLVLFACVFDHLFKEVVLLSYSYDLLFTGFVSSFNNCSKCWNCCLS